MGQARKPIFRLTPADGAIGAHGKAVADCGRDFEALARVSDTLGRNVDLVEIEHARASLLRHIEDTGEILYDATG